MIDEEYLNDLDDVLDNLNDADKLYECHFTADVGWDTHRLVVWDAWDLTCWPMILVRYEMPNKEFFLRLYFKENSYETVTKISLAINDSGPIEFDIGPKPLSYYFEVGPNNKLLPGSEKKCIAVIDRFWKLRAFL